MHVVNQWSGDSWTLYQADNCEVLPSLPDNSISLTLYSPPYLSLYSYSNSPRDISNSKRDEDFWTHYRIVIQQTLRLLKPGRIACVDVMNLPAMLGRHGHIGLIDFRGKLIAENKASGFIYHSEFCSFRDPLLEAVRTKSKGLMHLQLTKDSTQCRAGLPQYLLCFRKPGKNDDPVAHPDGLECFIRHYPPTTGNLAHERWRRVASPIWMDIDFTRTLNTQAARDERDVRHICPMAMDIIERALQLYSKPGDVVLDPFNGIGSTGYCALKMGRRYVGVELKDSYAAEAARNLAAACETRQTSLFDQPAEVG